MKQLVLEQMSLKSTLPMMQAAGIMANLLVTQSSREMLVSQLDLQPCLC